MTTKGNCADSKWFERTGDQGDIHVGPSMLGILLA